MKKIILCVLSVAFIALSCKKTDTPKPAPEVKFQKADLVKDWINVHLKVIKNTTGVPHPAFSRHFAYTGIALYEVLRNGDKQYKSIAGSLNGNVQLPVIAQGNNLNWPAAANAAMAEMLRYFYASKASSVKSIDSLEQIYFTKYNAEINSNIQQATEYGKNVAAVIINWSKLDGADNANIPYTPLGEGYWEPTAPAFGGALLPGWGNNKTILPGSISNTIPGAPIAFSKDAGSPFYNMVKELYDVSQSLTETQKAIANFWDDAPNGKYVTVFGHWFSILKQVLDKENTSLMKAAEAYMRLGITMNEAGISCWKAKYTYSLLRPITYIRKHMGLTSWNAYITTPAHPEYSAAHATFSAAGGYALESVFGKNYHFTDHTYDEIGMNSRSYSSFEAAGAEAGISRLYGGIHYRPSIDAGNTQGKKTGENVFNILNIK